ncbi:pinensin family lanthipeptide [Roseivirga sp. BDSF3-8]|uniref:pinensin family lanthipeptide n=1 Tax=Roseivirga sp. BDSF3-8 TaxID=3241598 RepID=UPI0035317EF1
MKKKLTLNSLEVKSFVTNQEKAGIQGGERYTAVCAEPTAPASCQDCGPTVTCPTFGYGDCTNFYEPCIG